MILNKSQSYSAASPAKRMTSKNVRIIEFAVSYDIDNYVNTGSRNYFQKSCSDPCALSAALGEEALDDNHD